MVIWSSSVEKVRDSSAYPTSKLKQKKRYIIWYNKNEGKNYTYIIRKLSYSYINQGNIQFFHSN